MTFKGIQGHLSLMVNSQVQMLTDQFIITKGNSFT